MNRPLTKLQTKVLAVIADAKAGEISGLSISTWLLRRKNSGGIHEVLRTLENRGLIIMRPMDDPKDEFRKQFPDRMKAMFSIAKVTE